MKCSTCNREIPDHAKFCSYCGAKTERKLFCPSCGTGNPPQAAFCIQCGTGLAAGAAQEPPVRREAKPSPPSPGITPDSVTVYYKTNKSAFGTTTVGKLSISPSGVSFAVSFSLSTKSLNHSYSFSDIRATEFKMTRMGLQPQLGYNVTLKDGTVHEYAYDIIRKSALQRIDEVIRSQIR